MAKREIIIFTTKLSKTWPVLLFLPLRSINTLSTTKLPTRRQRNSEELVYVCTKNREWIEVCAWISAWVHLNCFCWKKEGEKERKRMNNLSCSVCKACHHYGHMLLNVYEEKQVILNSYMYTTKWIVTFFSFFLSLPCWWKNYYSIICIWKNKRELHMLYTQGIWKNGLHAIDYDLL